MSNLQCEDQLCVRSRVTKFPDKIMCEHTDFFNAHALMFVIGLNFFQPADEFRVLILVRVTLPFSSLFSSRAFLCEQVIHAFGCQ